MVCSRLEWTVAQWSSFLESKGQVQQWMESVEQELGTSLPQPPGLKEKSALLERLRAIQADVDAHAAALSRLADKSVEMHEKTGDQTFGPEARAELNAHFTDISAVVKVICLSINGFSIQANLKKAFCTIFFQHVSSTKGQSPVNAKHCVGARAVLGLAKRLQ